MLNEKCILKNPKKLRKYVESYTKYLDFKVMKINFI